MWNFFVEYVYRHLVSWIKERQFSDKEVLQEVLELLPPPLVERLQRSLAGECGSQLAFTPKDKEEVLVACAAANTLFTLAVAQKGRSLFKHVGRACPELHSLRAPTRAALQLVPWPCADLLPARWQKVVSDDFFLMMRNEGETIHGYGSKEHHRCPKAWKIPRIIRMEGEDEHVLARDDKMVQCNVVEAVARLLLCAAVRPHGFSTDDLLLAAGVPRCTAVAAVATGGVPGLEVLIETATEVADTRAQNVRRPRIQALHKWLDPHRRGRRGGGAR